jgi:hypothetical protein
MTLRLTIVATMVLLALTLGAREAPARSSGDHNGSRAHASTMRSHGIVRARRGSIPIYVHSPYVYTPYNYTDIDNPNCPLVRLGVKTDNGLRWARACPR